MHRITLLGMVTLPILSTLGCNDPATSTVGAGAGSGSIVGGTSSAGFTMTGGAQHGGAGGAANTLGNGGQTALSSSVGTLAAGGHSTTAGSTVTGGTTASGGTTSVGTGGTKAGGGATSVSTGGTKASGGATSVGTGGTKASGGATSVSTGGTKASGGATSVSTGGTKASGGTSTVGSVIGAPHTGEITFYDDNGNGTCMFGVTGETDVAALAIGSWSTAAWCGACADVTGPKGTVRVKVVNQCPSCAGAWDLDLNKSAFLKIQAESVGRFSVTWSFVPCGIASAVKYRFKEGSSSGWTGVLVSNTNLPISKLEWSTDKTTWHATQRQEYNYFQDAAGFGPNPVYVRVTAVDGRQLIDQLPVVQAALVVTGSANFD